MTIPNEAVDAAIDMLDEHGHNGLDCRPRAGFDISVRAALEAAVPAILAAERERIAALIDTNRRGVANADKPYNEAFAHGLVCAARWVREQS